MVKEILKVQHSIYYVEVLIMVDCCLLIKWIFWIECKTVIKYRNVQFWLFTIVVIHLCYVFSYNYLFYNLSNLIHSYHLYCIWPDLCIFNCHFFVYSLWQVIFMIRFGQVLGVSSNDSVSMFAKTFLLVMKKNSNNSPQERVPKILQMYFQKVLKNSGNWLLMN